MNSASKQDETTDSSSFTSTVVTIIVCNTLLWFMAVAVPFWIFADDLVGALALGGFCAFWAGPGYGAMVAMAMWPGDKTPPGPPSKRAS